MAPRPYSRITLLVVFAAFAKTAFAQYAVSVSGDHLVALPDSGVIALETEPFVGLSGDSRHGVLDAFYATGRRAYGKYDRRIGGVPFDAAVVDSVLYVLDGNYVDYDIVREIPSRLTIPNTQSYTPLVTFPRNPTPDWRWPVHDLGLGAGGGLVMLSDSLVYVLEDAQVKDSVTLEDLPVGSRLLPLQPQIAGGFVATYEQPLDLPRSVTLRTFASDGTVLTDQLLPGTFLENFNAVSAEGVSRTYVFTDRAFAILGDTTIYSYDPGFVPSKVFATDVGLAFYLADGRIVFYSPISGDYRSPNETVYPELLDLEHRPEGWYALYAGGTDELPILVYDPDEVGYPVVDPLELRLAIDSATVRTLPRAPGQPSNLVGDRAVADYTLTVSNPSTSTAYAIQFQVRQTSQSVPQPFDEIGTIRIDSLVAGETRVMVRADSFVIYRRVDLPPLSSVGIAVCTRTIAGNVVGPTVRSCTGGNLRVVGVREEAASPLSMFPNPTNASVTLSGTVPAQRYYLTNATGQVVLSGTTDAGRTHVDVRTLPQGVYAVVVRGERSSRTGVLVKR